MGAEVELTPRRVTRFRQTTLICDKVHSAGRCMVSSPARQASFVCGHSFLPDRVQLSLQSNLLLAAHCSLVARAVSTAISPAARRQLASLFWSVCTSVRFYPSERLHFLALLARGHSWCHRLYNRCFFPPGVEIASAGRV